MSSGRNTVIDPRQGFCTSIGKDWPSIAETSGRFNQNTAPYGLLKETFVEELAGRGVEDGGVPKGILEALQRRIRKKTPNWQRLIY